MGACVTVQFAIERPGRKQAVDAPGLEAVFFPYPAAVKAGGLVFVSGCRGVSGAGGFAALPAEGQRKAQGFGIVDGDVGEVAVSSWNAHQVLDKVLKAAGSDTDQILRQHVWQRDKRHFPIYEDVRRHWQPAPAPSSGLGVGHLNGPGRPWIGLDAIAVAPGEDSVFTARSIVAAVDHKALPSASHYSQAVRTGPLVFTAGHIPIKTAEPGKPVVRSFDDIPEEGRFLATGRSHPDSRDGPIAAQAWYVYAELRKLLAVAGLSLADTVLSTVYLADLRDTATFHRIHSHFFPDAKPALMITGFDEVGHRGCSIEIELTVLDPAAGLRRETIAWDGAAPFDAPAGVRVGDFVFLSGMSGTDEQGRPVAGTADLPPEARGIVSMLESAQKRPGLAVQAWAAFSRLAGAMKQAGGDCGDLAKLTVYLADEADCAVVDCIAAAFIPRDKLPAFERIIVHGPGPLPRSCIQLDAIAYLPSRS